MAAQAQLESSCFVWDESVSVDSVLTRLMQNKVMAALLRGYLARDCTAYLTHILKYGNGIQVDFFSSVHLCLDWFCDVFSACHLNLEYGESCSFVDGEYFICVRGSQRVGD